ncbi:MAG: ribosome maturation factor RimM, partial [Chitinophagales bacterium]
LTIKNVDTGALTEIGYVVRTHGVKGHLRIAFNENIKALSTSEALFFLIQEKYVPYFIEEIDYLQDGNALVLLEELHAKEVAGKLARHKIYGPAGYILEENPVVELPYLGYTIIDLHAGLLGEITGVTDMAEYFLVQINQDGKELLIALHSDIITKMDTTKKILHIQAPEGFLDM